MKFLAAFRVMFAGAVILANAVVIGLETDEKEEDWSQTQEMTRRRKGFAKTVSMGFYGVLVLSRLFPMLEDLKWYKQRRRSFQLMHNHVLAGGFNISNITTSFTYKHLLKQL